MTDYAEEERQQLIIDLSRHLDDLRETVSFEDPDWGPLHDALPIEHCDGFMWMHRVEWESKVIEVYKHGITRRSLHLDHSGNAYLYRSSEYFEIPVEAAVNRVFEDIEQLGCTRETPYSEEYRREKYRKMHELGWTVIT